MKGSTKKSNKKYLVILLIVFLLALAIGYAAFTDTLNITRKAGEQTTTPVEEPVIDEQPQTNSTTASTAEETSSTTSSENIKTTSTTKTESTSTKSENQQIVGKVDWLKPETWGQEQYILVAVLVFLILTIIVSIILKIKIKKDEEEEIEFPGAE